MKNIPFFYTENGVASLTLSEIPYNGSAYIRLQNSEKPELLLQECCDFSCAAGAHSVYATGGAFLEKYPLHTIVVGMRCIRDRLADTDAALFPVQDETLGYFRDIYNEGMKTVPNASYMTHQDSARILKDGNGYFVHRGDILLGIGIAKDQVIDAIVSLVPGSGKEIVLALNHALTGDVVEVEVATTNERAVRLYESMGFLRVKEISRWYKIL